MKVVYRFVGLLCTFSRFILFYFYSDVRHYSLTRSPFMENLAGI
jgi:hypothetical protein